MRRLLPGGAPVVLVVIAVLFGGCGSSGDSAGAARTEVGTVTHAAIPLTAKPSRGTLPPRAAGDDRHKAGRAVAPGAGSSARGSSPATAANPICRMTLGGQTVSVPCQLRAMLADEYRRNPALARFLAAAAARSP